MVNTAVTNSVKYIDALIKKYSPQERENLESHVQSKEVFWLGGNRVPSLAVLCLSRRSHV